MARKQNLESHNLMGAFAYLLWAVSGVLILIVERKNSFARFHAMQSILLSVAFLFLLIVLSFSLIGLILIPFLLIAVFVIWIVLMWKAFSGELVEFPYIGQLARKQLKKMG